MAEPKDLLIGGLLDDLTFDLPEEGDEKFRAIPEDEYVSDWEEEVQRYLRLSANLPKNTIKYEYVRIPSDLDSHGFIRWCQEEIRRCKEGHNGMCGKMYFFFNYCWIREVNSKIRPKFRVIDNEWFKFLEACQASKEWGIICVKRRRVGASWKEASDMLHDCIFNTYFSVGMNSKTDRDSRSLFQKVKFLYENLPSFLHIPSTASSTKDFVDFSYYIVDPETKLLPKSQQKKIKVGNQSSILSVAPTDNAYEGAQLSKWICDEAGKIKNLSTIWSYTEDCLLNDTVRVGMPVIFGTAGDIGAEGRDLEYMWRNAKAYKLKQFFFSGWMGLNCDEYGNDDKEGCIRWIIYGRHRRESLRAEELNTFIQKYPLSVSEAFTITQASGVGNLVKVRAQMQSIVENPPVSRKGFFRCDERTGSVSFVPDPAGKLIIYEHPKDTTENLYFGSCDPADHDDVHEEASDLSLYIFKRMEGTDPVRIVAEYTDRPADVVEFYEQALFCLIYYNKAKVLIERNRYLMIKHFKQTGYTHLLATTPMGVSKVIGGRLNTVGLQMTPAAKEYLKGLIAEYIEDYCQFIPSYELLQEFLYFGARNTDKAMAFGIGLIYLFDRKRPLMSRPERLIKVPHFGFRNENGAIKRVQYTPKTV